MTAISLTVHPTNSLLLVGMIVTGAGIIGMWLVDKGGIWASLVTATFMAGIALQAMGLTSLNNDYVTAAGIIFTGLSVFGMWLYETKVS